MPDVNLNEESTVAIPLKNLIGILSVVAVSTWAYYGVIERLNRIEATIETHWEEIEENDDWIDNFEPPKEVRETVDRVRELEIRISVLEDRLNRGK